MRLYCQRITNTIRKEDHLEKISHEKGISLKNKSLTLIHL